jgi:5-(carboxyamino)imidazole ribonucleotide synthase
VASDVRDAKPILPPATIGVFGSGQLGRMLGLAARPMGYRFACFSPEAAAPAAQVADFDVVAPYADADAVRAFVRRVDVVTFEFENVPALVAEVAEAEGVPVRPAGRVLQTTQQRLREKQFLRSAGLPAAPWAEVHSPVDLVVGLAALGAPAILKTAAFGYDGKGQVRIEAVDESAAGAAWKALGAQPAVLEQVVDFVCELSVVAVRGADGRIVHYGAFENVHSRHILDVTIAPARVPPDVARAAGALACAVLEALSVVGVLCVEMFLTQQGDLIINELAPRPHNSGHLTIEAAATSQFEQQVRAACALPLGDARMARPAAMANILGDVWQNETTGVPQAPHWERALALPGVKLHLYGKEEPRPGRKMGHLTACAESPDAAEALVRRARSLLTEP